MSTSTSAKTHSSSSKSSIESALKPTVREWCQANFEKYQTQEEIISNCMRTLGVKRDQVVRKLRILSNSRRPSVGISESDLRKKCDVTYIIEDAVKRIPDGRYISDADFREFFCKLNTTKYRPKANLPQFDKFKGIADGVTYWGKKEGIERLISDGTMRGVRR